MRDRFDDGPEGKLQRQLRGAVTEYFREKQAILARDGMYNRAIQGIMPSRGTAPFAYRFDNKGRYEIVKPLARHARMMFEKVVSGWSTPRLADWLNEKGVPSVRGADWVSASAWTVLTNPVYKGEAVFGQYATITDEGRLAEGKSHRQKVRRPRDEWIIIPAPAIVEAKLWDECQRKMQARGGRPRQ